MAVDRLKNLRRLREMLRKQRRATRIDCHNGRCQDQEPIKFAPLAELQQDCDAVEWAGRSCRGEGRRRKMRPRPILGIVREMWFEVGKQRS
jgi:hypothetical protein